MMEENRKGPGIFYAVVGVATLVVAIIGATFAYFSASATVEGGDNVIQGGTNDQLSTALTAKVERVVFEGANATSGDSLVPSDITATADSVNAAVAAKCVDGGYTGCHLYHITASSTQDVAAADLQLSTLTLTGVTNKDDWKYIIYSNDGVVSKVETTETVISTSGPILDYFESYLNNLYKTNNETYGGYSNKITKENDELISTTTINYEVMDILKYSKDNPSFGSISNNNNQITLEGIKSIYTSLGATCE